MPTPPLRSRSLASHLNRLLLLSVAAPVAVVLLLGLRAVEHAHADSAQLAQAVAEEMAQRVADQVARRQAALAVLAASPDAARALGDPDAQRRLYDSAIPFRAVFGGDVLLVGADLQMHFNTRFPLGQALPPAPQGGGRAAAPLALQTGQPAVSDRFEVAALRRSIVVLAVPVLHAGQPVAALTTAMDLAQLTQAVRAQPLRPGWAVRLHDSRGALLAAWGEGPAGVAAAAAWSASAGSQAVLSPVARPAAEANAAPGAHWWAGRGLALRVPVGQLPWHIQLALDPAVYTAPMRQALSWMLLAVLASLSLALVLGRWGSRGLATAVSGLAAPRSHVGDLLPPPPSGVREVDQVAGALAAESAARSASEAMRQAVFDGLTDGLLLLDPQGRVQLVNPALCALYQVPARQLLGQLPGAWLHRGPGAAEAAAMVPAPGPSPRPDNLPPPQLRACQRADGQPFWCEVTQLPVALADGDPLGTLEIHRDVTAQRAANDRLRAVQAQLQAFVRHAPARLALFDRQLLELASSQLWQSWRQELGAAAAPELGPQAPLSGAPGLSLAEQLPWAPPHWWAACQAALAGRSSTGEADAVVLPDGRRVWLSWDAAPWVDQTGDVGGVVFAVTDVSALEQARRAAEEASARLAVLFDRSPTAMAVGSIPDGRFVEVNAAYEALLGYPSAELIGRSVGELVWVDMPALASLRQQVLAEGEARGVETQLRRRDGTCIEVSFSSVKVDIGGAPHFINTVVDIGPQKQAQRLLTAQGEELERLVAQRTAALAEVSRQLAVRAQQADAASRAKSDFLANMSHEIRTPMNAIIGLTHLMSRDSRDALQRDRLGKVDGAARHLLAVINDILDLSKVEAGKMVLDPAPFAVDTLVMRALDMVRAEAQDKGLELVLDTDHLPSHLCGDATRLSQMLINLLGNAVKFTEQGWVRLRGERLQAQRGRVQVRFEVQDTGPGIPADQVADLFSAFTQGESGRNRRHGGTGLGLALTRHLAALMDGEAGVDSAPGAGSRFWFTVWLGEAEAAGQAAAPVQLTGLRALLVDDLPEALAALREQLQMLGMQVQAHASGSQAVAAMATELEAGRPFDVVLVDWRMPPPDGEQTLRALQAVAGPGMPPAVLVTAFNEPAVWATAQSLGCETVLVKPVTASALHDALVRVLRPKARLLNEGDQDDSGALAVHTLMQRLRRRHGGQRILLAEDHPVNREVALALIESAGLLVETAEDGQQAVDLALARPYDLVLMDMQMPVHDGLWATRALRQQLGPRLPIVAMTANAFGEDRQACLAAGMNDHLPKPVDAARLYEMLLRWLPLK